MEYEVLLNRALLIAVLFSANGSSDVNIMHVKLEYDDRSNTVLMKSPTGKLLLSGSTFEARVDCIGGASKCIQRFSSVLEVSDINGKCGTITLRPAKPGALVGLCLDVSKELWYGGSELQYQRWPYKNITLPWQPYVTNDIVPLNESVGNVIERYWLNSNGVGVFIPAFSPLYFKHIADESWSNAEMCFIAASTLHMSGYMKTLAPDLVLNVCKIGNILETHRYMSKEYFDLPIGQPDTLMIKSPIWSTWAKFKVDINQEKVLNYADDIVKHGFTHSQLEIDDMFSSFYGEFDFSLDKFPDATRMIRELREKGFRVTVWVTPFANVDAPVFREGMTKGYWLRDSEGRVPALVRWWQGVGAIVDVNNGQAVDWFVNRLVRMKSEFGVDSFKFDAGETTYVPSSHQYSFQWVDPNVYTSVYVAAVSRLGSMIEVRCGYRSQRFPVFVRMGDKESRWGFNNGLRSLIPTVLTMGLLGYPFILPDMVGGNGYNYDAVDDNPFTTTQLPDRELYIRWLEVTAYLPAMQFSFVPWQYDGEVVAIAKKYVRVHEEVVTPLILLAAKEATSQPGSPIIRPLWMLDPEDLDSLECETEFLVGNTLLVAPVLEQGTRKRDIYLPGGTWEDGTNHETVQGRTWLRNYDVPIDHVPTFRLVSRGDDGSEK